MTEKPGEQFTRLLLQWYKEHGRDLPWRRSRNPYHIWISEIILQQTRVSQGYDYYQRFIRRFPDIQSIVDSTEEEVLNYWQGLGYYSRARNLYAAARQLHEAGGFRPSYDFIRSLKGVGDYTAAAISSFAYDLPVAVVDGNVYRVLSRCFAISEPVDTPQGQRLFKELAAELLDRNQPSVYNSAIMDFGALQCTPQNPDCLFCPFNAFCLAAARGRQMDFPVKAHKTKTQERFFTYLYMTDGDRLFIHKRTAGIWKNMYELPLLVSDNRDDWQNRAVARLTARLTASPLPSEMVVQQLKHVLTHLTIYARCYRVDITHLPEEQKREIYGHAEREKFLAVSRSQLDNYPLPRLITLMLEQIA